MGPQDRGHTKQNATLEEKEENKDNSPPTQPEIRTYECVNNNTPPTRQVGMAISRYDKRLDCKSCTTMTDEPSAIDLSIKSPGCGVARIKSGWEFAGHLG